MGESAEHRAANLLIVGDDPADRACLEAALDGLGATLVGVRGGEEAPAALGDAEFAAVLLDVRAAGPVGLETARRIREHHRAGVTPILFLAAREDDPGFPVREAYRLGAVDHLVRPLVPEVVRSKVMVFLDLFRHARASARAEAEAHERRRLERRQALLIEAGRLLGSSLDYETTLRQVCDLVVPTFADWCSLDLVTAEGQVERLHVAHKDPEKVAVARDLRRRYPPRPDDGHGLMRVLRTGEPEMVAEVTPEMIRQGARDADYAEALLALGLRSVLLVPLNARGRTLGAMTLVSAESSRQFTDDDLKLALELGSRAALAVDNARLFSEAEEAARRREEALALHRSMEEKLTLLVEASGSLSVSLDPGSVLNAILDLSQRLIDADAYSVWRFDPAAGRWGISIASGLSDEYRDGVIEMTDSTPRLPSGPIVAEDVLAAAELGQRGELYRREGIRSLLSVPLRHLDKVTGTLVFYYRTPHRFTEIEVRVGMALSNLAASAIATAELYAELKENDRRKDEFLAMLAHELRNPLSAIANGAALLEQPALDDEGRIWAVEIIGRQVRHLSRLMDDLLDVSRVSRGKVGLKRRRMDAATSIRQAVETTRPLIRERKHELRIAIDAGGLTLDADPTRLEQVVVNLLTNAAKYTESGGRIWLEARRDGDSVAITVRDNGMGIAPEQLPRMFELFAQGDRSLARSEGGLGIGLTLVKSLVEMHGGSISARSDGPGHGSEFTVRLPAAPSESPAPEFKPGAAPTSRAGGPEGPRD